jgi:hypothetical protein
VSHQGYQAHVSGDVVAPLTFIAVLVLLFMLSSVVKRVGDVLLYVPSKLGVVQRVAPGEVQEIDLRTLSPALLEFTKPGKYSVFTSDTSLLEANVLYGADAAAWLVVKSQTTGEQIGLVSVERGLRPYDTPLADGRPIFTFEIAAPGASEAEYSYREAFIAVVPDYVSGNESAIWIAYLAEAAVLAILLGFIDSRRRQRGRRNIESMEAIRIQKQSQNKAFWEAQRKRDEEKNRKRG